MAYRQPRIPEYRESEGEGKYLRTLILFLKDFTMSAWTANNQRKREIEEVRGSMPEMPEIAYPVTSVNGKHGDVQLSAADTGALAKDEKAADSTRFDGRSWGEVMLGMHPVGSIYMSVRSDSPASIFGGTWEQLQNRFLLGAGSSYAAASTGGAATHTLTSAQMPAHVHEGIYWPSSYNITFNSGSGGALIPINSYGGGQTIPYIKTGSTGGGAAHNNMPPYLTVYMWKRVS